jgi:ubiquinone/menaquinone biosynthesis C-methylase UbiE
MVGEPAFAADLYRGTAPFYDAFRVPYPPDLLEDLCRRAHLTGAGRLLDIACGTGQIAFPLAPRFSEVWAVDQEPETVDFARAMARRLGVGNVRWIAGRAEDLDPEGSFELVTIGNAFHRLQRHVVAESARRWLGPGGHLALLWSNPPWDGSQAWQHVLADIMRDWTQDAALSSVPADLAQQLADERHAAILTTAGFSMVGDFGFVTPHVWGVETLTGFMCSTSILSHRALGQSVGAFERDLRMRLLDIEPEGTFTEEISFSYTLARSRRQ